MLRASVYSLAVLSILVVVVAKAEDSKGKSDQDKHKATISSVDTTKGTITVMMKDHGGKKSEKTLTLADKTEYLDSHGKAAKLDAFHTGDRVVITEKDGKITEMKKRMPHAEATITKVDAQKGTITVTMKDKQGKDVEKTFYLTEDVEYLDSAGNVSKLDVFQSGEDILLIEEDGKIKEVRKESHSAKPADKSTAAGEKKSDAK